MGFGEYAGLISFGIFTTNIIALNPGDLPGLIIGAFVFSLILMKVFNSIFYGLEKLKIGFVVISIVAGLCASYGMIISFKNLELLFRFNGMLWLGLGIIIMKFNIDSMLE